MKTATVIIKSALFAAALPLLLGAAGIPELSLTRLSLQDALRLAQQRHIDVLVANDRIEQALARLNQARSVLLPTISIGASESRQTRNLKASGFNFPGSDPLIGPFNTLDARIKVTQTLFDAGAIARLRAARSGEALSIAQQEQITQDILLLAATLYWEAKRSAITLESAKAALDYAQEALRIARSREGNGTASPMEIKEAQAQYAANLHGWHAAVQEAIDRQLDLTSALGLSNTVRLVLTQSLMMDENPASGVSSAAVAAALAAHPKQRAAQEAVAVKQAERAAENADWFPKLSVAADYGASGQKTNDAEATYSYGASVSMPVFEGGLRLARVHEASSNLKEAQQIAEDTGRHLEADAVSATGGVQSALALVESQRELLAASLQQLSLAQNRLSTGLGSNLELLAAMVEAISARNSYESAVIAYRIAQAQAKHALGEMNALLEGESL